MYSGDTGKGEELQRGEASLRTEKGDLRVPWIFKKIPGPLWKMLK